jgi:predicted Rossmann-fold nucleotide-binding protein
MRKFWLVYKAKAIIAFPGGFGTCDEIFELLTLIQTLKINKKDITVYLYGEEYWKKIINFEAMLDFGAIDEDDYKLIQYVSDPMEALSYLKDNLFKLLR